MKYLINSLGLIALMSATRTGFNDGAFCFEQKVPIPV
jgi:hypothetical protein